MIRYVPVQYKVYTFPVRDPVVCYQKPKQKKLEQDSNRVLVYAVYTNVYEQAAPASQ